MRKIYVVLPAVLLSLAAAAQEDSTKPKNLDEVVITGQYKPQSVRNSVYQVKVITGDRLRKQAATKLQDVLNNELNIRFSQDLATGGSNITLLGLKGQNVKILLDGLPIEGRQGTSNEVDINQIDINSVERIELVEGPMSVVYGADALAGVINIITKKNKTDRLNVTAKLQEETVGKEYGWEQGIHNQYVSVSWKKGHWEAGGSFGHNYFGGWKDTATGRELIWHWKDQLIATGFAGYASDHFNIRYRIDGLDELITNPGNFVDTIYDAGDVYAHDQEYLSRRVMQQLQSEYRVNNNLSFQAQAAYTKYRRQVYSTELSQRTGRRFMDNPETQSLVDFSLFTFRTTAQYKWSSLLSLQPGVDINMESGRGERLKSGNNKINDYAFFITAEITPSSRINIRPGLRFIHNSVYDSPPVVPSLNTKFVLSKSMDLRLAYARGFRSPSLRELYFNFIDANHTIIGNPNLKAETSNSFTASVDWKHSTAQQAALCITLSGFYNRVNNLIDYAFSATSDTARLANVANSKNGGGSVGFTVKYKQWYATAGASYTGFYNDYSASDKSLPQLQWSAEASTTISYGFTKVGLDANLFYKLTGKQPSYVQKGQDIVLSELSGYQMADFTLNKHFSKTALRYFTLSAGIRNLFDVTHINSTVSSTGGIHTGDGGRSLAYGRSYFAGLVFNWNKK